MYIHDHFGFTLFLLVNILSFAKAKANVTLTMGLSYDINPECDATVYKITVCAGEFTNECQLVGPLTRFVQATCASDTPADPIFFVVDNVADSIELDVIVQRVGDPAVKKLRRTEFRLTETGEVAVSAFDLTLIVRFQVNYLCLTNYFGKLCNKFCNTTATEHTCDDVGKAICKAGYRVDAKANRCIPDRCYKLKDFCANGGTCVNSPNSASQFPYCVCPSDFIGSRCEFVRQSTTQALPAPNGDQSTVIHSKHGKYKDHSNKVSSSFKKTIFEDLMTENKTSPVKDAKNRPRANSILTVIGIAILVIIVCIIIVCLICLRLTNRKHKQRPLFHDHSTKKDGFKSAQQWDASDFSPIPNFLTDKQQFPNGSNSVYNGAQLTSFGTTTTFDPMYRSFMNDVNIQPTNYSLLDSSPKLDLSTYAVDNDTFSTLPRNCLSRFPNLANELCADSSIPFPLRSNSLINTTKLGRYPLMNQSMDADHFCGPNLQLTPCALLPMNYDNHDRISLKTPTSPTTQGIQFIGDYQHPNITLSGITLPESELIDRQTNQLSSFIGAKPIYFTEQLPSVEQMNPIQHSLNAHPDPPSEYSDNYISTMC